MSDEFKSKKMISVEDYTQMVSSDMTAEIYKFVKYYEQKVGKGTGLNLVGSFVQELVLRVVYEALNSSPDGADKVRYEKTMSEFNLTKTILQDSIAFGFSDAMAKFTGKEMDYFCNITPVPDPTSKLLN